MGLCRSAEAQEQLSIGLLPVQETVDELGRHLWQGTLLHPRRDRSQVSHVSSTPASTALISRLTCQRHQIAVAIDQYRLEAP